MPEIKLLIAIARILEAPYEHLTPLIEAVQAAHPERDDPFPTRPLATPADASG
jgi:hypothetical protein